MEDVSAFGFRRLDSKYRSIASYVMRIAYLPHPISKYGLKILSFNSTPRAAESYYQCGVRPIGKKMKRMGFEIVELEILPELKNDAAILLYTLILAYQNFNKPITAFPEFPSQQEVTKANLQS